MRPALPARRRHPRSVLAIFVLLGLGAALAVYSLASHRAANRSDSFCASCHVPAEVHPEFTRAGHQDLACAGCHATAPGESAVLGVARRLGQRGWSAHHSGVPDAVCVACHVDGSPEDRLIAGTVGHDVHLASHVPEVEHIRCATCHDATGSRPTEASCTTSGCHEDVTVELAGMSHRSDLQCILCHDFLASRVKGDSLSAHGQTRARDGGGDGRSYLAALGTGPWSFSERIRNRPHDACFECHAGESALGTDMVNETAHGGLCAACHDPHHHQEPQEALESCSRLGCHVAPERESPFHRGLDPDVLPRCERCHEAHTWSAPGAVVATATEAAGSGDDCASCHDRSAFRGGGIFSHIRHADVECARCHLGALGQVHGELTVWSPSDCMACHHVEVSTEACADCHAPTEMVDASPTPWSFTLSVLQEPTIRRVGFDHRSHDGLDCTSCHVDREDLGAVPDCASCHDQHHATETRCATCHERASPEAHTATVHLGCEGSGCHSMPSFVEISSAREVCLVCHQDQREHEMGQACGGCHQLEVFPLNVEGGHGR